MPSQKTDWGQYQVYNGAPSAASGKNDWSQYQVGEDAPPPGLFDGAGKAAINSLPMVGGIVGGALGTPADAVTGPAGTVVGAGIGGYLGTAAKNALNRVFYPEDAPKTITEVMLQPVKGGAEQAAAQAVGESVAPYLSKAAQSISDPVANALGKLASKKAVSATGATGAQASKFAPEAGQELLDRGIVKFGDSQSAISKKATDAVEKAGSNIGDVLSSLDKRGAVVDQKDIISSLRQRASSLSKDPSQFHVSDSLNDLSDRIEQMVGEGESKIPLSQAESTKRGFQSGANYNSSPLDLSKAKEAASVYRQAVEEAATKFDPKAAEAFKSEKDAYKLLSPIQEAAAKRESTLGQSPHGGILDTATAIAGEGLAGVPGVIVAPIARREISTRIPSTLAASANSFKGLVQGAPAIAEGVAQTGAKMPTLIQGAADSGSSGLAQLPAAANNDQSQANRSPAKGEDLWAQQGLQKLGIQDQNQASQMLQDPKMKQLLILASDFEPGSKAMKNIMNQLQKGSVRR